jgi:glutamine amidotransferase
MCRHLAYLGVPGTLHSLVVEPAHSLYEQSWAPRRQRHGTVNADGFGAGWYVDVRPEPVRYRRAQPIWTDPSFASLAPTVSSGCILAAVRSATPGFSNDEASAAPFTHDRWLFSHNGRIEDWSRARKSLWTQAADVPEAQARVDSALMFGLAVNRWSSGATLGAGLAAVTRDVLEAGGGRLTMLATDGASLAGTVYGEPLYVLSDEDGVVIASEPHGRSDTGWREIPDGTLVEAGPAGVTETDLNL